MRVDRRVIQSNAINGSGFRPAPEVEYWVHLDGDDRRLHESGHQSGCWCEGLDEDEFFKRLYDRCFADAGFKWHMSGGEGRLIVKGPGIAEGRTDELEAAVRGCTADG